MDWLTLSGGAPSWILIPLGIFYENQYYTSDECLTFLENLTNQLNCDDPKTHSRRRGLGFVDIINRDLKHILICCNKDQPSIFRSTVKLLVGITSPIECLVFEDAPNQREKSPHIMCELNQLLYNAKESFLDPRTTRSLIDHIVRILENQPVSTEDSESVNDSLLLIRNILHVPERPLSSIFQNYSNECSQQNRVVWNLFVQGFDRLLINLLASSHKNDWVKTIAQLIALLYKDRSVESIQKRLGVLSSIVTESFDDDGDESNTSFYNVDPCNTFQFVTNPTAGDVLRNPSDTSSPEENSEMVWSESPQERESTTWNATANQKPDKSRAHQFISVLNESSKSGIRRRIKDNRDVRKISSPRKKHKRKKLRKRSRSDPHTMKFHYTPTEEGIVQLLKIFTVDFMLNGYNTLVCQLHRKLLQQDALPLDKSHFLWLITYFLRFTSQLEMDGEHLKDVITIDVLCYLTWEAVCETEEFQLNSLRADVDLKPSMHRLHLCVTAIQEYLQAVETYSRSGAENSPSQMHEERISQICGYLPAIRDLCLLFLLQLRHFDPSIQSRYYLCDIIKANHVLLLTLERATPQPTTGTNFDLRQHLQQFCTKTIIARYAMALENFKTNGLLVNDCIFTMLHHVGCDLDRVDLLIEPVILRTFSKIWEDAFNICDDWYDLTEYVAQKYFRKIQSKPHYETVSPRRSEFRSIESEHQRVSFDVPAEQAAGEDDAVFLEMPRTDIESLISQLIQTGFQKQLNWIQSSLLTACSARLGAYDGQEFRHLIACISLKMNLSCPIVPWTEVEASALRSELFLLLLHHIGLIPPAPHAFLYPRIPFEWSANTLYSFALFFGPVLQQEVDFDLTRVSKVELPIPNSPVFLPIPNFPIDQAGSPFHAAEITKCGHNDYLDTTDQNHLPIDNIRSTSSLEAFKMDSSEDEEMEDEVIKASALSTEG
ncbi:protein timeless-like isoform X2 [Daphnia pulicaria]|uniref:protein timeless-like isoform X2 n=1 Tax=Daphnia pulicaria TaxID=35523 RepID=UPI001EE9EEB2|nr:protein timeless-like isoform X2 [Daphnia pulicaria]